MSATRYIQNKEIAWRRVAGDGVLVAPLTGDVTVFNEVGTRMWELWDAERTVDDVAGTIMAEFAVDSETARRDAEAFAADLVTRGLLRLVQTN